MLTTEERILELKHRVRNYHRRKGLCITKLLCVTLCMGLICMAGLLGSGEPHCADVHGMYGSALLVEDAGGYVPVGIVAFILAIVITRICPRYKDKNNEKTLIIRNIKNECESVFMVKMKAIRS